MTVDTKDYVETISDDTEAERADEIRIWKRRTHDFWVVGALWLFGAIVAIVFEIRSQLLIWQIPAVLIISAIGFFVSSRISARAAGLGHSRH